MVYDADGNMISGPLGGKTTSFVYDSGNLLLSAGDTTYRYDAEDNRISITEGGKQTDYIVNPNAPLSQVLIKTDSQGNKTFYVYGLGLLGQENGDGTYETYHYDLRGSTVALTDGSGKVTDCFAYTPYGQLAAHDGKASTPFLFCGEYGVMTDGNGLCYMRARYYDTATSRMLTEDSYEGDITNPLSLNLYTYAYNNPIMFSDPSGHIGVKSDGTIYMAEGDTELDRQLLQLKIDYSKPCADKQAIAAQAAKLRADNPNSPGKNDKWHISADKSLDYYTVTEITDKLNNTMKDAESKYWGYRFAPDAIDYARFYFLVRNGGPYDLKNQPDWQHEQFMYNGEIIDKDAPGNICYGYLGKAMGFDDLTLRAGAGFAQMSAGTSKKEWQNFNTFGDDPRDTARINQGIQIFQDTHSWIWW